MSITEAAKTTSLGRLVLMSGNTELHVSGPVQQPPFNSHLELVLAPD